MSLFDRCGARHYAHKSFKAPYVHPLIGGRVVAHLKQNVEALSLELNEHDLAEIERGYDFDPGFPHTFISMSRRVPQGPEDVHLLTALGSLDHVGRQQPIKPYPRG
jgi:hypothetical protein